MEETFYVISYYSFSSIEAPEVFIKKHKKACLGWNVRGRIYVSEEGINGQISVQEKDAESYMNWLRLEGLFPDIEFKIHVYNDHAFEKLTVKYRKQLVALDLKVDLTKRGEYLDPKDWREKLENKDGHTLLLDVRNSYEWKVGHFENAILPEITTFREFPFFAKKLKEQYNVEKTQVMMYCTGGIRCELFSSLLKKNGFQNVFQLKGGVINYGLKEGKKYWKGKLFVFDDRLVVPISKEETEVLSTCYHCETATDVYYNCANMDCNELFLCCAQCIDLWKGCCSQKCLETGRVRPFNAKEHPKPFRKLPFEEKKHLKS